MMISVLGVRFSFLAFYAPCMIGGQDGLKRSGREED